MNNVVYFDSLPSTQEYAKAKRQEGKDLVVTANRQTGGKGTKGRSFSSSEGGVYLSKLSFYQNFPSKNAFEIMVGAAVAVCETLRFYGVNGVIKWPNDIFVNDKKIAGILIENVFSGNLISSSIVGIGLNVNNALPLELAEIATTMAATTGKTFPVDEVRARLIAELEKPHCMETYLSYLGYMGQQAIVISGDERIPVTLLSVDEEGGLWVKINEETRRFTAAEISIKL